VTRTPLSRSKGQRSTCLYVSSCTDYIRLFLDLERPELDARSRPTVELCGNLSTISGVGRRADGGGVGGGGPRPPPAAVYSSGRSLVAEFHSGHVRRNRSGFIGHYRFIDTGPPAQWPFFVRAAGLGTRSWGLEGPAPPLKICRSGQSMFRPPPIKFHILSFIGQLRISWGLEGPDPLKICRSGQSMFRPPIKCHLLSLIGQGRRSWGLEGPDPLKICRSGQSMFCPRLNKCHILSFKTVVGQLCKFHITKDERFVSKWNHVKLIFRGAYRLSD